MSRPASARRSRAAARAPSAASSAGSVSSAPSPNTMRRAIVSWTTLTSFAPCPQEARRWPRRRGRSDSIASSETVTSIAVPKLVAVLMNASSSPSTASRSGTAISLTSSRGGEARLGARQRRELLVQCEERRISAHDRLAGEPVEQVCAPLAEVADARREPVGMQAEAQDVDRRLEQVRRRAVGQQRDRPDWLRPAPSDGRRRSAGYGSWPRRSRSSTSRTGPISGSSRSRCANAGA